MKSFFLLLGLCLALNISNSNCYAQTVSSSDLLSNTKAYDGEIVTYQGEVIGDVMIRQDYAWLHVNDGAIALGIWANRKMVQDILYTGNYHKKGDIVEVTGIFHRSCLEHGGDLDIHASEIKKILSGGSDPHPLSRKKAYLGIFSLVLVLFFYALKKIFQR